MDLKELINFGIDVGDMYVKVSEMVRINDIVETEGLNLARIETEIQKILSNVPRDEDGCLRVNLMNGTILVLDDEYIYMEVENCQI